MTRGAASGNLVVPQLRINSGKCTFSFLAAFLFNALPLGVKQLAETPLASPNALIFFTASFKRKLREFFARRLNSIAVLGNFAALHAVFYFTATGILLAILPQFSYVYLSVASL